MSPSPREVRGSSTALPDHEYNARTYLEKAKAADLPAAEREQFKLLAAEALSHTRDADRSLQIADNIDTSLLDDTYRLRLHMSRARAWQTQRKAEKVLQILDAMPARDTDSRYLADYHLLRARAYAQLGNHLEAAREYSMRNPHLYEDESLEANRHELWNELNLLSADALRMLRHAPPPDEFSGWMRLAEISKLYQTDATDRRRLIRDWQQEYPMHSAPQDFIEELLGEGRQLLREHRQIALLLPLSGRFASAGTAVRDGFLAAYYNTPEAQRAILQIHDTAHSASILPAYEQALQDGAEMIIGPLSKEGVSTLLGRPDFPVPTLILNMTENTTLPDNMYQFALAPEEEARQAADYAWQQGHDRAAILVPQGDWGERLDTAFQQHWLALGGTINARARYDSGQNDFSQLLRNLLKLDESAARRQQVQQALGKKIHFEPRRREDVDFLFLGAFPRQARLLRPQLKFHHASNLPIIATSHVYSGNPDREQDQDMDGIRFGDMPWMLKSATATDHIRNNSQALAISDSGLQRLRALGVDSYNLISVLDILEQHPHEYLHGETGTLHLNAQRQVQRELFWAEFTKGLPRLLQPEGLMQQ